jgi:hypothetical protein
MGHNSNNSYTMIHIAKESKNDNGSFVTATTKIKCTKGWPAHPKEVPFYRNMWTLTNLTTEGSKKISTMTC